jgi:hypothetical protein
VGEVAAQLRSTPTGPHINALCSVNAKVEPLGSSLLRRGRDHDRTVPACENQIIAKPPRQPNRHWLTSMSSNLLDVAPPAAR